MSLCLSTSDDIAHAFVHVLVSICIVMCVVQIVRHVANTDKEVLQLCGHVFSAESESALAQEVYTKLGDISR